MATPEPWMRIFPTVAAVAEAGFTTLDAWAEHLPQPTTDVERTVYRRVVKRRAELAKEALRREAPELADQYEALLEKLKQVGLDMDHAAGNRSH